MSYVNLQGKHESFADTLRNWFFENWNAEVGAAIDVPDKPKFVSPGGIDDKQTILRENDWKAIQKDQAAYVEFTPGDTEIMESTNSFTYGKSTVVIDVFGEYEAEFIADHIDTLLINNFKPDFLKTNGEHSAIIQTEGYALDWAVIQKNPDAGIVLQYSADIELHWQKNKT
ncbi:MAG: hypothetical protein OXC46_03175 [Thaumarchaeota archaeon]|nr:hypothetical protein [Nitrososphaerota archaeon]